MLRGTLLYLSEQSLAKRVFGGPLAKPLVSRFVAGVRLSEALHCAPARSIAWRIAMYCMAAAPAASASATDSPK